MSRHHLNLSRWLQLELAPRDAQALTSIIAETVGNGTAADAPMASLDARGPMHAETQTPASGQKTGPELSPGAE